MFGPNGEPLSPTDIANQVRSNPDYSPGEPVELNSCSTGQGANSFAQQLSSKLGAPVTALDNTQWHYLETFAGIPVYEYDTVGPTQSDTSGHKVTFNPMPSP